MRSKCGLAGLQGILKERTLHFKIMQPHHFWDPQVEAFLSRPSCLHVQPEMDRIQIPSQPYVDLVAIQFDLGSAAREAYRRRQQVSLAAAHTASLP